MLNLPGEPIYRGMSPLVRCVRMGNIRQDEPAVQRLLRAVDEAHTLMESILAVWPARVLAIHIVEDVLTERVLSPTFSSSRKHAQGRLCVCTLGVRAVTIKELKSGLHLG